MKPTSLALAVAVAATLAACGTTMSDVGSSGYLSDYSALASAPEGGLASRRTAVSIDPTQVSVADVQWRVQPGDTLSPEERADLLLQLRNDLIQQVRALPAAPGGRAVQLRAAVTRIETVSPALNTLATVLLIGPLDRGGAALEIEAVDTQTGRQVAGLRLGYFAPLSDLAARFSKLAPARIALNKAASDFARLLVPVASAAAAPVAAAVPAAVAVPLATGGTHNTARKASRQMAWPALVAGYSADAVLPSAP